MPEEQTVLDRADYMDVGLVANPFRAVTRRESEQLAMAMELTAASSKLLGAIEAQIESDRPRSIWVEKSDKAASMYHRGAESRAEKAMINEDELGILPCYIQLFMMHVGRVRATVNVLAERIATRSFDKTLAAWIESFVSSPDEGLAEWDGAKGEPWAEFVSAFEDDPIAALEEYFGACEIERRQINDPVADIREVSLDEEPVESEESPEEDAITAQIPPATVAEATGEIERVEKPHDPVVDYIIAYTKAHLSPVIARGLIAYRERGFGQLAQELKITKAPRKTYLALIRFAKMRFRHIVFMFDGWDNWPAVPEDLRVKIISALTELKLLLGEEGTFIFMVSTNHAPALEDQFAGGSARVVMEFPGMKWIAQNPNMVSAEVAQAWADSVTLGDASPISVSEGPLSRILEATDNDLAAFSEAAAHAVDLAVRRGTAVVEDADVDEALKALATD